MTPDPSTVSPEAGQSEIKRRVAKRLLTIISKMDELTQIAAEAYPEVSLPCSFETARQEAMSYYSELITP